MQKDTTPACGSSLCLSDRLTEHMGEMKIQMTEWHNQSMDMIKELFTSQINMVLLQLKEIKETEIRDHEDLFRRMRAIEIVAPTHMVDADVRKLIVEHSKEDSDLRWVRGVRSSCKYTSMTLAVTFIIAAFAYLLKVIIHINP